MLKKCFPLDHLANVAGSETKLSIAEDSVCFFSGIYDDQTQ